MDYQIIVTNEALSEFCQRISRATYCAIDTEFVREKTYYPLLSLIQIATESEIACLDPFALSDFSPLKALLVNPQILKIFHSSSQDLEILYQEFEILPFPVFDTQLAAAVLGYTHQISYAELVHEVTGTRLDKKHTRADWSKRPLSDNELNYAMDDVRYLLPVYRQMEQRLQASGRYSWIKADLDALSNPSNYQLDFDNLWQRLKGVQKLKGVELQIAQDLCRWRETTAQQKNRPRRWIVGDDCIIDMARKKPIDTISLKSIRTLSDKAQQKYGECWLQIINQAVTVEPANWPQPFKPKKLDAQQQALADCLMAICREIADKNNIALASLVTRKDIDNLILNRKSSKLASGWYFEIAGQQLLAFMHGQCSICVNDGRIQCVADKD